MNYQKASHSGGENHSGERKTPGKRAANSATDRNWMRVTLPVVGTLTLPPGDQLAYLGGLAVLTALEIVDWPVALVLGAGHLLASDRHSRVIRDFGEALEEA